MKIYIREVDFNGEAKAIAAAPELIEKVKSVYDNLTISDEDLETIIAFAYSHGYIAGIREVEDALRKQGLIVKEAD